MESISKKIYILPAVVLFLSAAVLYGQNAVGLPAGAEIQNLERSAARPGIQPAEKRDILARLASLHQLSGDLDGASRNWLEAAAAEPGKTDETALAASAFCLAAMGEWEHARAALRPILQANRSGPALLRARFLDACISAWNTSDVSALIALTGNPEFAGLKSAIYFVLWKTAHAAGGSLAGAGAETWKQRLLAEFPQSPEGRVAANENAVIQNGSGTVLAKQNPLWLLLPGRNDIAVAPAAASGTAHVSTAAPPAVPASAAADSAHLQTGLFSRQENAQVQLERLKAAGFSAAISPRTVNGSSYWAVTVPAGNNVNSQIRELKNAGFESFPVK